MNKILEILREEAAKHDPESPKAALLDAASFLISGCEELDKGTDHDGCVIHNLQAALGNMDFVGNQAATRIREKMLSQLLRSDPSRDESELN